MISMPPAGRLMLSAAGKTIPFFGLQWPALIGESKNITEFIKEVDETGGTWYTFWTVSMPPLPCFITIFYTMARFGGAPNIHENWFAPPKMKAIPSRVRCAYL